MLFISSSCTFESTECANHLVWVIGLVIKSAVELPHEFWYHAGSRNANVVP
jgi:hypothetical protein